jgi:hypothetical protein
MMGMQEKKIQSTHSDGWCHGGNYQRRRSISMSITASRVGAQGDPCTATIFVCIVRCHLLYSPLVPYL